jgi:hypothetical protein
MTIKDLCPTKSSGTKSKSIIVNASHTHWVHFLNVFLFLAGPDGLSKKTLKFGLNTIRSRARGFMLIPVL